MNVAPSQFGLARPVPALTRSPRSFILASCLSHSHDSSFTRRNITTTLHSSAGINLYSYCHFRALRVVCNAAGLKSPLTSSANPWPAHEAAQTLHDREAERLTSAGTYCQVAVLAKSLVGYRNQELI